MLCCVEAPKVDLSKLAGKEIRVRAGEPIRVDVPVSGSPVPVVSWKKENKDLSPSDRVGIGQRLNLFLDSSLFTESVSYASYVVISFLCIV